MRERESSISEIWVSCLLVSWNSISLCRCWGQSSKFNFNLSIAVRPPTSLAATSLAGRASYHSYTTCSYCDSRLRNVCASRSVSLSFSTCAGGPTTSIHLAGSVQAGAPLMHHLLQQQDTLKEHHMPPPRAGLHHLIQHVRGVHTVTVRSHQAGQPRSSLVLNVDSGSIMLFRKQNELEGVENSGTEVSVELSSEFAGGMTISALHAAIASHCSSMRSTVQLNGVPVACHDSHTASAVPPPTPVPRLLAADLNLEMSDEAADLLWTGDDEATHTSSDSWPTEEYASGRDNEGGRLLSNSHHTGAATDDLNIPKPQPGPYQSYVSKNDGMEGSLQPLYSFRFKFNGQRKPAVMALMTLKTQKQTGSDLVSIYSGGTDFPDSAATFVKNGYATFFKAQLDAGYSVLFWWTSTFPFPSASIQCFNMAGPCSFWGSLKTFRPKQASCPSNTYLQTPPSPLYQIHTSQEPTPSPRCSQPGMYGQVWNPITKFYVNGDYRTACMWSWACLDHKPSSTPRPTPTVTSTPLPHCSKDQQVVHPALLKINLQGFTECPPSPNLGQLFTCTHDDQVLFSHTAPETCTVSCLYSSANSIVCQPKAFLLPSSTPAPHAAYQQHGTPSAWMHDAGHIVLVILLCILVGAAVVGGAVWWRRRSPERADASSLDHELLSGGAHAYDMGEQPQQL